MNKKYEDMLYLEPPVSKIHRKMSISERAAQFMPNPQELRNDVLSYRKQK